MKHQMIAVYDNKAEAFLPPQAVQSNGAAIRSFSDAVNQPDTAFNNHPSDYALFNVGQYDDATALFTPTETGQPIELSKAINLITTQPELAATKAA